jgi:hypothetical protein
VKQYTVYVLDSQSGYASRKTVDAAAPPAELSFSSPDFKLVQKVRVQVTGKGDKPIAQGIVSLTDGSKAVSRKVIQPSSQGMVDFDFVVSGGGSITVSPQGGSATTKEVTLDLRKGETMQTIPVALPEVAATVEPPPGSSPPAPTGNAPGSAPANAPAAPAAPQAPVQPAPAPAAQPLPPPASGGGWGGQFIAWVFLLALLGGGYLYMRSRGITADMLLKKLGVQPDVAAGVGGAGPVGPGAPAAPPPLVADPNQCPFCGQMKDPGGNCACTVLPGGASPAGGFGARAYGDGGGAASGPRLVGVQGTYMGHVFPVSGAMVLGREATNPIPLDQDTTTSRRHAQIVADGGGYRIQDLGSSNGTYVNGARVTEAALASGDEISVGGTRFRFEV